MKGLFLREFYILKNDILNIIATVFFLIGMYFFMKVPLLDLFSGFFTLIIFISTYLKYDVINNKNNFNMYLKTLPVKYNKIILAKYIFVFIITIIITLVCFVLSLFFKEDTQVLTKIKYSAFYPFFINFCLLYFSITYLIHLLLKGTIIGSFISSLLGIVFSLLLNICIIGLFMYLFNNKILFDLENISTYILILISIISTGFSLIATFIIYKITCLIYKNQSL